MEKFLNDKIIYIDCDDTLVLQDFKSEEHQRDLIAFNDFGKIKWMPPNKKVVDDLKRYKKQKYTIVVWSQQGGGWAKEVVTKLGLEKYVDLVISKPLVFIDDLPAFVFMSERQRIKP
jgi:histidinol phosphatase-like enzyme